MPRQAFRSAIDATPELIWQEGLRAIKPKEGRGQITARDPRLVLGSACIDDDCLPAYPNDHRWDYVIGYESGKKVKAYFVEVHPAQTNEVSKMGDKLQWLHDYLEGEPQRRLKALPHEIHWVASGKINIPKNTPQYKKLTVQLRRQGLHAPVKQLELI